MISPCAFMLATIFCLVLGVITAVWLERSTVHNPRGTDTPQACDVEVASLTKLQN